jgi:carbon monoxide dehydrogenase subunit G
VEITNNVTLGLPPERAYAVLVDLERVAPCMPGAELGAELPDGSREIKVHVKLGPMKFVYQGSVRVAEQDAAAGRAVLVGTAKEARGQGDASGTITMLVRPADRGSEVTTHAQIELTGRAAQMGHGVVQAVSKQLMGQMTAALEERFAERAIDRAPSNAVPSPGPGGKPRVDRPADQASPSPVTSPQPVKPGALAWAAVRAWVRGLFRRSRRAG